MVSWPPSRDSAVLSVCPARARDWTLRRAKLARNAAALRSCRSAGADDAVDGRAPVGPVPEEGVFMGAL